ncbi:hypothetical protein PENARI_c002G10717 [Penicillium arizonense]|jgi:hypothetical protein|uniref:Uncharacterized protein n=1 Tax=Penicillium arizonense TaxID=1835702 RepID=A0A1F5LVP5_PENAI|nr:hypothetical protein PENARI_c002G10717 [Penicillium arizonense]OGE57228.1 hypothetical protein PENARI_c002G10717 [Penicillium arizonense]
MLFAGDGDRRGDESEVSPSAYITIARRIFPSCRGARATGGRHKDERENKADSDEVRQGGLRYLSKKNGRHDLPVWLKGINSLASWSTVAMRVRAGDACASNFAGEDGAG